NKKRAIGPILPRVCTPPRDPLWEEETMALDQSIVAMCRRVLRRPHELTAASQRGLMTCSGDGRSVNTFSSLDTLDMPMLDAYITEGALSASAERKLLARITDLLLEHEGVDPKNERARPLAWVFVHRPKVYVAGAPPKSP